MNVEDILAAKKRHKVMHVVEAFGAGVGQSVRQIYSKYTEDVPGVLVYGARDLNKLLLQGVDNMTYLEWSAGREINLASDFKAFVQLLRYIDVEKPSIIHCHSSKAGVLGRIAAFVKGVPCVYTPHSYSFLRVDISWKQRMLFRLIERFLSRLATTVACGLEEYKIARAFGGRVEIVENGVNLDIFKPSSEGKFEKFTFISVGRRAPQKDFPFFTAVANRPELAACQFIWITGEAHEDFKIGDNISVLGSRTPLQLVELLQRSHCFLSTSLWEGLSRAVIEGAACGLPLLLRNVPGNREIAFRPLTVKSFDEIDGCVSAALKIIDGFVKDSNYGLDNSEKVKSFYNSAKTQSRVRSIYDAMVFARLKF